MPSAPKPKRKKSRKGLIKKADKWFSLYVREVTRRMYGELCPFGCGEAITQAFHFITRSKYAVRWDTRNCIGSCGGCNYTMEFNPSQFVKWFLDRFGKEAYLQLIQDSNRPANFSDDYLEEIAEKFKQQYEAMLDIG